MNHNVDPHELLKGLAPGYVLMALEPEEIDAFKRHLSTCRECAREVAELRAVVSTLPEIAEQREPPAALKTRVLGALSQELQHAAGPAPRKARQRGWASVKRRIRRAPWRSAAASAVAAVFSVALLVTSTMAYRFYEGSRQAEAQMAESYEALRIMAGADSKWLVAGNAEAPRASGILAYSRQKNSSSMVLWGVPLEPGKTYVAWTVTDGEREPVGSMWKAENGLWIVIPGDAKRMDGIGVTLKEPQSSGGTKATQIVYVDMQAQSEQNVPVVWQD